MIRIEKKTAFRNSNANIIGALLETDYFVLVPLRHSVHLGFGERWFGRKLMGTLFLGDFLSALVLSACVNGAVTKWATRKTQRAKPWEEMAEP